METAQFAIIGCIGGFTKSLIGMLKAKARKQKIKIGYSIRTIKLSILSGAIIGALVGYSAPISFIAGYIGSDALEALYLLFKNTGLWKKQFKI